MKQKVTPAPVAAKREQRIRLRCEGSPVKFDGTVIESAPDGTRIVVRFDGPLEDMVLLSFGDRRMVSNCMDREGNSTEDVLKIAKCNYWEVL